MARRHNFDHVVIETTGLADPQPIIETFYAFQVTALSVSFSLAPHVRLSSSNLLEVYCCLQPVAEHYALDGVLTLVDAKHIGQHLDEKKPDGVVNEALSQVAYADRIILNKIDLVTACSILIAEHS